MLSRLRNIDWTRVMYFTLFFIGVIVVFVIMSIVSKRAERQLCKDVRIVIEGTEAFIDQQDISKLVNQHFGNPAGKRMATLPFQEMEGLLQKLPYVSGARVHGDMNGCVHIDIYQREVVMRVINKYGKAFYIDRTGRKIPTTLKYVPHILAATGNITEGYTTPKDTIATPLVRELVKVAGFVEQDELWRNQVVQLYVNSEGDIELVPRVGTQQLVIGSADSLAEKFALLKAFYTEVMPKVGINAYGKVNVKYAGQIICEKRGNWSFTGDSTNKLINNIL